MYRTLVNNDLVTLFLLISIVIVAVLNLGFGKRLQLYLEVFFNSKYLNRYGKDLKSADLFNSLLFVVFITNVSIFVYHSFNFRVWENEQLLFALGAVLGVFLLRFVLGKIIGYVFDLSAFLSDFSFKKASYRNFLGLMLIPINGLIVYKFGADPVAVVVVLTILLSVYLMGYAFLIKGYIVDSKFSLFYIFLYLCALEIAPFVIVFYEISKKL